MGQDWHYLLDSSSCRFVQHLDSGTRQPRREEKTRKRKQIFQKAAPTTDHLLPACPRQGRKSLASGVNHRKRRWHVRSPGRDDTEVMMDGAAELLFLSHGIVAIGGISCKPASRFPSLKAN